LQYENEIIYVHNVPLSNYRIQITACDQIINHRVAENEKIRK